MGVEAVVDQHAAVEEFQDEGAGDMLVAQFQADEQPGAAYLGDEVGASAGDDPAQLAIQELSQVGGTLDQVLAVDGLDGRAGGGHGDGQAAKVEVCRNGSRLKGA